jgi:hypothetical protein
VPIEAKPIFRPDVVRLPLLGFSLPEQVAQRRENLKKKRTDKTQGHTLQPACSSRDLASLDFEIYVHSESAGGTAVRSAVTSYRLVSNVLGPRGSRTHEKRLGVRACPFRSSCNATPLYCTNPKCTGTRQCVSGRGMLFTRLPRTQSRERLGDTTDGRKR